MSKPTHAWVLRESCGCVAHVWVVIDGHKPRHPKREDLELLPLADAVPAMRCPHQRSRAAAPGVCVDCDADTHGRGPRCTECYRTHRTETAVTR